MKAKLAFLLLIGVATCLLGGFQTMQVIVSPSPVVAAGNTFTLVHQTICFFNAGSNACTVTSTGSGHLLVLQEQNGSGAANYFTAVTGAGTWVLPAGCQLHNATIGAVSCAYVLSSSSGVTTINVTMTSSSSYVMYFYEFSFTLGSTSLDTLNTNTNTATTTPAGVTLTLSGGSDVILQQIATASGTLSSITTYTDFQNGSQALSGWADLRNTASGTAPTWTNGASATSIVSAIAFQ